MWVVPDPSAATRMRRWQVLPHAIWRALTGKADVILVDGRARLTDPMVEHWLHRRHTV